MYWGIVAIGIAIIAAAFWAGRTYQKKRTMIMYDVRPQRLYAKDLREGGKEASEVPKEKQREPCPAQSCPIFQAAYSMSSLSEQQQHTPARPPLPTQLQSCGEKGRAAQLQRFAGYSYVSRRRRHDRKQSESGPFHAGTARRYRFLPNHKKQAPDHSSEI